MPLAPFLFSASSSRPSHHAGCWTRSRVPASFRARLFCRLFKGSLEVEAALHSAEKQRIAALRSYEMLDTPREAEFDDIGRVVSAICETPISVINLVDHGRQWFKAEVGLGVR